MKYEQSPSVNISEQEKAFRSFISNDAALTYFLETGTLRKNAKFAKEEVYKEPAFLAFISPYFEDQYIKAVFRCFDLKDTNLISDIAANPLLLDDAHKKIAFDKLFRYLEEKKAKLISMSNHIQQGYPVDTIELSEYTGVMTICILNYLPIEFQDFRTAYAQEIIKLARALASKDFNAARNIITDVRQLKCEAQTSYDAEAFYQVLENAAQKAAAVESASEERQSSGSIIWGVIAFVIFIIKMILIFAD
jgi:hypothetical protein